MATDTGHRYDLWTDAGRRELNEHPREDLRYVILKRVSSTEAFAVARYLRKQGWDAVVTTTFDSPPD